MQKRFTMKKEKRTTLHTHIQHYLMHTLLLSAGNKAMQTAVGVFGGEGYVDGTDGAPLMVVNAGNSTRSAISSLNAPTFIPVELCRAHILGDHPCAKWKSVQKYQTIFLAIDFALIENDEDILWEAGVREPKVLRIVSYRLWTREEKEIAVVSHRGFLVHTMSAFGKDCSPLVKEEISKPGEGKHQNAEEPWVGGLWTREEKEIAVVTNSGFLYHTMASFGKNCNPSVKEEISKHFSNCELRSVVIIDRKSIGSDPSTSNFSGKMPTGLDLPSGATL